MQHPLHGVLAALPTPMREDRVDLERSGELLDRACELGVDGVVVGGAIGEAPALNDFELRSLLHQAATVNRGRTSLVAAIGTASTRETAERARYAASCGFDALLVVTPYYVRPGRRGLLLHHGAIADAVDLPIALHSDPARTGCELEPAVAAEIAARHENVVAVVESSREPERVRRLRRRSDLDVLCGVDGLLHAFAREGVVGAVSALANLAPQPVAELLQTGDDPLRARELQAELAELVVALELDEAAVTLKAALAELGLCRDEVRPPLARLDASLREELRGLLRRSPALGTPEREAIEQE